jgi:hypothetical protein
MGHVDKVLDILKNNSKDWLKWTFGFYLSLSTILENSRKIAEDEDEPDSASDSHSKFKVTVSLFQLIIIAQRFKMLQKVLDSEEGLLTSEEIIEEVCKPVKVTGSGGANKSGVVSEENWIFGATSLHLAAKYLPTGLKKILDTSKMHQDLINNVDSDTGYSPLHVAAMKQDSLSTR